MTNGNMIIGRERLVFSDAEQLRSYYEQKYAKGGYREGGYAVHGVDVSAMYHHRRFDSTLAALEPAAHESILDAGCGNGALAARIAPSCRTIHAVDIASNALDARHAAIPNLRFHAMDIEALGFSDGSLDKVCCVETLEHLLSPTAALKEFARVLRPGGRLVLTYPTINRTLIKRFGLGRQVPISEHLNEWSCAELLREIRRAGMMIDRVEGIAFDFGYLLALKHVSRFFASSITRASLAIRGWPANAMFVSVVARA